MYEKKRSYAPEIVANLFMSRPWHFFTAEQVVMETEIPIQNVRAIVRRLVEEGVLVKTVAKYGRLQCYYFIGN